MKYADRSDKHVNFFAVRVADLDPIRFDASNDLAENFRCAAELQQKRPEIDIVDFLEDDRFEVVRRSASGVTNESIMMRDTPPDLRMILEGTLRRGSEDRQNARPCESDVDSNSDHSGRS